eukprot:TRINITY_DN9844_c0_g1_i1.p1 TRINITY_DN9844_c0_g1~~TRINITY_DN9844_c0_g1_i1.p1  ORF type:complete len:169 (+),score=34.15 TRINITY_DN9844_c0_g1_i1:67-507(+)
MLYSLFIFNRFGTCIFNHDFHSREVPAPKGEFKLVAGLVFSLNNTAVRQLSSPHDTLKAFRTNKYALHYYETKTGYRFAMTTDPSVPTSEVHFEHIHTTFVDYVVKDPTYTHAKNSVVTSEVFARRVREQLEKSSFYATTISGHGL